MPSSATRKFNHDIEATIVDLPIPSRARVSPTSFDCSKHPEPTSPPSYDGHSISRTSTSSLPLPPYAPSDEEEVPTVAELAFKYGFLFPPMWIYGAYLLISPLQVPPPSPLAWLPDKTEAEKQMFLYRTRKEELYWARKSLIALITFIVLVLVISLTVFAVIRSRS